MALTKVSGDFIKAGSVTQAHLHSSHGITTSHLTEGDKLFFTNARVDSRIGSLSSSDLSEGTNLYYTDARARAAISGTGSLSYNSTTGVMSFTMPAQNTSNITEGSNLYYTDARADARIAAADTGDLSEGTNLYYTDARADARVALIVDSAPGTLNTLNELAAALGDDANFSTTVTNSIALKAPLASPSFTGNATFSGTVTANQFISTNNGNGTNYRIGDDVWIGDTNISNTFRVQGVQNPNNGYITFGNSSNTQLGRAGTGPLTWGGDATFAGGITVSSPGSSFYTTFKSANDYVIGLKDSANTTQWWLKAYTNGGFALHEDNVGDKFTIAAGGNATFAGTIAASGYYDSSNTVYYTDPASRSNLFTLDLNAGTVWDATTQGVSKGALHLDPNSATDHAGAAITFGASDHNNGQSADAGIYIRSDGSYGTKMYFATTDSYATGSQTAMNILHNGQVNITRSNLVVNSDVRGTAFYDSNDTGYYLNPNSTSVLSLVNHTVGVGTNQSGSQTSKHGVSLYGTYTGGEPTYGILFTGAAGHLGGHGSVTDGWATFFTMNDNNARGWIFRKVGSGNTSSISAGGVATFDDSVRSPIFYDSANTAQFINPGGSTSRMLGFLKIGNSSTYNTDDGSWGSRLQVASNVHARIDVAQDANAMRSSWYCHTGHAGSYFGTTTAHHLYLTSHNATRQTLFSGYSQEGGSYRAPIFYDSNDTTYFLNPSSSGGNAFKTIGDWRQTSDSWSGEVGGKMQYHGNHWYLQAAGYVHFRNASGTNTFYVDSNGVGFVHEYITGNTSLRAPIFYDSNDTGYYLDANGTSRLYHAQTPNGSEFIHCKHSGSDFANGTLVTTDIPANATNGASYVIEVTGKSYSGEPPFAFKAQGYLYNNTIINHSGVNYGKALGNNQIKVFNHSDNKLAFWWPRVSYWNSFEVRVRDAGGSARNRALTVVNSTEPSSSKKVTTTLHQSTILGHNYGAGSLYSDRLYDQNDTGYYVDPASKSFLSTIHFNGSVSGTGAGSEIGRNHAYDTMELKGYGAELMIGAQHAEININYRTCNNNASGHTPTTWKWRAGSSSNWSDHYMGLIQSSSSMRAPIFYDSNDTTYYTDPASTSSLKLLKTGQNHQANAPRWDTSFYVAQSQHYYAHSSTQTMYVGESNHIHIRSIGEASGSFRAPTFYDSNNTSYYVNPDSSSNIVNLTVANTIGGSITRTAGTSGYGHPGTGMWPFYNWGGSNGGGSAPTGSSYTTGISIGSHPGDQAYGWQMANNMWNAGIWYRTYNSGFSSWYKLLDNTTNTQTINASLYVNNDVGIGFTSGSIGGKLNIKRTTAGINIKNDLGGSLSGSTIGLHQYTSASMNSGGYHMVFQAAPTSGSDTNMLLCNINGNLRNRNNSYGQYSDRNIKENIVDATSKLEDVKKLRIRNFNFIGDDLKQIGLIAQETELVFPGLVENDLNPQGDEVKSLKYSVLVPILVKAMQEQQAIIDDLKSRLETLENQ